MSNNIRGINNKTNSTSSSSSSNFASGFVDSIKKTLAGIGETAVEFIDDKVDFIDLSSNTGIDDLSNFKLSD